MKVFPVVAMLVVSSSLLAVSVSGEDDDIDADASDDVLTSLSHIFVPQTAQVTLFSSSDTCQKLAPLECGFVMTSKETVLYPSGLLEFKWFSGMCSESCLEYIKNSEECKSEPAVQLLTLDVCQAYECGKSVKDACGPTVYSQLMDHDKACTPACLASMSSELCEGMNRYLPGWEAFESAAGPDSIECFKSDCQSKLAGSCPSYNAEAKNMMSLDLCLDECWQTAMTTECLNSGITIIDLKGEPMAEWAAVAGDISVWGPDADMCLVGNTDGADPSASLVYYTSYFTAIFPDLDLATMQTIMNEFEATYVATIKDALSMLNIDTDTILVKILNVTAGSVAVETEVSFLSEGDHGMFEQVKDAFGSMASSSFAWLGEVLITDVSVVGTPATDGEEGQGETGIAEKSAPGDETVEVVLQNDSNTPPAPGGGMYIGAIIAIAFAALIAGLVLIAAVVFFARRRRSDEEAPSPPDRSREVSSDYPTISREVSSADNRA